MPKKIDPALRERAVRLGMARESVRRWITQADIDDRSAGTASEESAESKRLKAENGRLRGTTTSSRRRRSSSPGSFIPATLIMAFVADQVAQGRRIESICRAL